MSAGIAYLLDRWSTTLATNRPDAKREHADLEGFVADCFRAADGTQAVYDQKVIALIVAEMQVARLGMES